MATIAGLCLVLLRRLTPVVVSYIIIIIIIIIYIFDLRSDIDLNMYKKICRICVVKK